MLRVCVRKKHSIGATLFVAAAAFILIFNYSKSTLSNFPVTPESHINIVQGHEHRSSQSKDEFFGKASKHEHTHTHRDGTTHTHEHQDGQCTHLSAPAIVCLFTGDIVPAGLWSSTSISPSKADFILSAHSQELLKPPILA